MENLKKTNRESNEKKWFNLACKYAFFFISVILSHFSAQAQTVLYGLLENGSIVSIDPESCTSQIKININDQGVMFSDITFDQGILYGCADGYLSTIDVTTGVVTPINQNSGVIDQAATALASDQNGNICISGESISIYNAATGVIENLGDLGNYSTEGDVEYIEGILYVSVRSNTGITSLLKVETSPFLITPIYSIPADCFGLANGGLLNSRELYLSFNSYLKKIDLTNGSISQICDNVEALWPDIIFGMTAGPVLINTSGILDNIAEKTTIIQDPKSQIVYIQSINDNSTFQLINSLGQKLLDFKLAKGENSIDMNEFSKGMYFVNLIINNKITSQKVITY